MTESATVPSPCTGICTLDSDDLCLGCGRTIDDITGWATMTDPERRAVSDAAAKRLALTPRR